MSASRQFLLGRAWLLVLVLIFASLGISLFVDSYFKTTLTRDQFYKLIQSQPVVADFPIFDSDSFPRLHFTNHDLVKAAFGPYLLTVRFFDAGYNEIRKPTSPGRYGALVEIRFPNGISDTRHVTLFKTAGPYNPAKDRYQVPLGFPAAFGLSKGVVEREQWNTQDFFGDLIEDASQQDDIAAMLAAAMHDFDADPARWHGFYYWMVDESWWTGLEKKLGLSLDYPRLVHLPDDYDKKPDQRWPMILFLHGTGECGSDLNEIKDLGPAGYINSGHPLPFIVVSPQCPANQWWGPEKLSLLVDKIESTYRVDPKRIYVTGLSMGGFATFDLAAIYPQKFAAIAPLSGGEQPDIANRLKTVPTWIFHGAEDDVISTRYSIDIADKMKQEGADVKLTIYPGIAHEKWDVTYGNPELYAWFLQHSLP